MAKMTVGRIGFTRFGPGEAGGISGFVVTSADGNDYGFWVDNSGGLRTAAINVIEASNFNPASSGTAVGAQTLVATGTGGKKGEEKEEEEERKEHHRKK